MAAGVDTIRIFVAMPGSSMGAGAAWTDIPSIERELLEPVRAALQEKTGRPVTLDIEKKKTKISPIHRSMFTEALEADVYIADLTGANPNVYLELGVRWALRDNVTIPIAQDPTELKFNVASNRAIPYGQNVGAARKAISDIVDAAVAGLADVTVIDNPVRDSLPLITVSRAEWQQLHQAVEDLRSQRADDLVEMAQKAATPEGQIRLLREALERNPVHRTAWYELGVRERELGQYAESIASLSELVRLYDDDAEGWRELGVSASKGGQTALASSAFKRAVDLNPRDDETWSTLGGLLRRRARTDSPGVFTTALLKEALVAYEKAAELSPNNTYPLLNKARIKLLLSVGEAQLRREALHELENLEMLAQYTTATNPEDPWKQFDLADTRLLRGKAEAGLAAIRQGIELTPKAERLSTLTSVSAPLRDFLAVPGLLDDEAARAVGEAVALCDAAASPTA